MTEVGARGEGGRQGSASYLGFSGADGPRVRRSRRTLLFCRTRVGTRLISDTAFSVNVWGSDTVAIVLM